MTRPARKRHRDNAKSRGTLPDGKWYRSRRALLGGFAVACLTVLAVFAARPLFNRQADSSTAYLAPQQQIDTLPVLASRASDARFAEEFAAVDPRGDDWGTEIFHQQALAQLKVLGKLVADREGLASSDLSNLVSPTFNGHALLPELEEIYSDGTIVVQRPAAAETDDAATFDGPQGLKRAIGVLLQPYGQAADSGSGEFFGSGKSDRMRRALESVTLTFEKRDSWVITKTGFRTTLRLPGGHIRG